MRNLLGLRLDKSNRGLLNGSVGLDQPRYHNVNALIFSGLVLLLPQSLKILTILHVPLQ
ncbi:MAG: hypothetical protein QOE37_2343 [Microbacteriaceae bacterium]|nr:hypothetical protein [Microbacteriaceae bacterium]